MQKTIIGIMVSSFCGFPTPQTEPQYLGAGKPDPEVRRLREEAKARVLTELESLLQSPVISQWGCCKCKLIAGNSLFPYAKYAYLSDEFCLRQ